MRRATSLAYTDADEDAERLLNFGDTSATGNEVDEWVETHAGRKGTTDNADNAGDIDDIPDLDGPGEAAGITNAMGSMSLGAGAASAGAGTPGEIPDMDEIPDMEEEDLEEGEDEATAPNVAVNATNASYVSPFPSSQNTDLLSILVTRGLQIAIYCKCERTMS